MQNPDEIVVGQNGKIMVAPVGTAAPADTAAAWGAGWIDLGLVSENGVTFRDERTRQGIPAWQLFGPARRVTTARATRATFVLRQWNGDTVTLAFGGGEVTEPTAGNYRYEPPDPEDVDERALGIEWLDGDRIYRLIIPKGETSEAVEAALQRAAAADLPITFDVSYQPGVKPFYLLTNDAAFEAAV